MPDTAGKVSFHWLEHSTKADHELLTPYLANEKANAWKHLVDLLNTQRGHDGPLLVDMYTHNVQTAAYAEADGADEETIVCGLFHDVAHYVSPYTHGRVVAEMLKPFISDTNYGLLVNHTVFQSYYSAHHHGRDRNARERHIGEPWYEAAVRFATWDQKAFDPTFAAPGLDHFLPMVRRIFARPPRF
jgi:predicted HD phosphohydrolase